MPDAQNPSRLVEKLSHIAGQARLGEMSDEDGLRDTLPFGMVEEMCDAIDEAAAALAAREAEVERLTAGMLKTADGAPIAHGMTLYERWSDYFPDREGVNQLNEVYLSVHSASGDELEPDKLYSTPEAALSATPEKR